MNMCMQMYMFNFRMYTYMFSPRLVQYMMELVTYAITLHFDVRIYVWVIHVHVFVQDQISAI